MNLTSVGGSSVDERETFSSSVRNGWKGSHQRDESTEVEEAMREVQVRAWEQKPNEERIKCLCDSLFFSRASEFQRASSAIAMERLK